jgi:hypothetical protein
VKRGDLVIIDTGVAPYEDGNIGLIITELSPNQNYFKVFITKIGFRFYMKHHMRLINSINSKNISQM